MRVPSGYCDLRVEHINANIIDAYVKHGYSLIAVNTTVNCSLLGVSSSNKKKRKIAECNDEVKVNEDKDWIPIPKSTNVCNHHNLKLTILNRLTIQITNIGQLQQTLNARNFPKYNILAVEPLNDHLFQNLVTSPSVDIIICKVKTKITPKDYSVAVDKNIHFELSYAPMLMDSVTRQNTLTLAHMLHIKGKSKNIILTSGAINRLDIRNPYDAMNLGFLLGFSRKQTKESITDCCHSVILKSYGRKLGKSAINLMPIKTTSS
ncbi:Polymerase/histidinol phosphatase-like,RNase P subunit p30 [Cinara cedri]|uniref:Polymerase/histidinol phosphatase-like,RNase P subunit p30 n=1 Tax=Cinara cedri TaxID=506608 RepID=A0A5E4NEQ4_9HEMI|nr:Polymerase/histidinol phosphatase-like,RNase P subunit p30 [Cinara cedri]